MPWAASRGCELREATWGVQAKPWELNSGESAGAFPPEKEAGPVDSEGLSGSKFLDLVFLRGQTRMGKTLLS